MEKQHQNLGNLIDYYPLKNLGVKRLLWLSIGTLMITISLVFGIIRLIEAWKAIEIHGRAVLLNRLPLPLLLMVTVFPIGVGLVWFIKIHWNDRINIHENGMVKQMSNRSHSWLWWQTERMDNRVVYIKFAGNSVGVRVTITLEDHQENHFVLKNNYDRMDELTNQIRQYVLPILYSKAHQKLNRGEAIHFHGQLEVNNNGVQIKEHIYPWHELSKPSFHNGVVTISNTSSHQKIFKSNVNQFKNYDLLVHLFENPPTQPNYSPPR